MHKFILLGVTGKIAAGKSLIMKYLKSKGYKTFNADEVVGNLYKKSEVQRMVEELIGFNPIDKIKLADIIFGDDKKRKLLEGLIHPMVTKKLEEFAKNLDKNEVGFAEVPLLYESKMENIFDYIIVTYCDKHISRARALDRGTSQDKFEKIDKIQMDDEHQKSKADFVLDSNISVEILRKNIDEIIGKINERNNT